MKQACFLLLELKRMCGFRDQGFDKLMRILADAILPEVNIMPPSLYLVDGESHAEPSP